MDRVRLLLIVMVSLVGLPHQAAAQTVTQTPTVTSDVLDAGGTTVVTGTTIESGTGVRLRAQVEGAGTLPSGTVTFAEFGSSDCAGAATDDPPLTLGTVTQEEPRSADISNAAGWDSATAWISNGTDQFDTNWFGGLFTGNDNAFFGSSSMAWRFTSVPLKSGESIGAAYLSLRIRKSRPSLASEGTWTWLTYLATDTRDGSDFAGETRAAFLSRFNLRGANWQLPLSGAVSDPFGTNDGATYTASPDISALVAARIAAAGWTEGGDIVIGIINDATAGIAEAEVVDEPDYVRLHLEWTTLTEVQTAETSGFQPTVGMHSYRAHYSGDATYAAADGPCVSLNVVPSTAPPSVGGVARPPEPTATRPVGAGHRGVVAIIVATLVAGTAVLGGLALARRFRISRRA